MIGKIGALLEAATTVEGGVRGMLRGHDRIVLIVRIRIRRDLCVQGGGYGPRLHLDRVCLGGGRIQHRHADGQNHADYSHSTSDGPGAPAAKHQGSYRRTTLAKASRVAPDNNIQTGSMACAGACTPVTGLTG